MAVVSSSTELSDQAFARRMWERRLRARSPELPADILSCTNCTGAGVHGGLDCTHCKGFGFLRPDGTIVEVHSARGAFYEFGAIDAVFETMCNIKLAYAGPGVLPPGSRAGMYEVKGRMYCFDTGTALLALMRKAVSQRFAMEANPDDRDAIEAWLLPTPAPDRARIFLNPNGFIDEMDGLFSVRMWNDPIESSDLVFCYRAMQHYRDMCNETISQAERVTRVIRGDYTVHPEHDGICEARPNPDSAVLKLNPVILGEPVQSVHCSLRDRHGVSKLKRLLPRASGPASLQMKLRGESGANIWSGSQFVEVMTL